MGRRHKHDEEPKVEVVPRKKKNKLKIILFLAFIGGIVYYIYTTGGFSG